ncbi:hypothetical protein PGB90_010214 [Kerria lacca]
MQTNKNCLFDFKFVFIYFRFALGVSAALLNPLTSIMIGEIASPHFRGTLNSLYRVAWVSGLIFESLASVIFESYTALANGGTILSLLFFPSISWLIESPYYLMQEGKYEWAERNIKELHPEYLQYDIDKEITDIKECVDVNKNESNEYFSLIIFKKRYIRKLLMCAILLNMFSMASGGSSIALYLTDILPKNKYLSNNYYPLIGCIVQLIPSLISPLLIDRLPRRFLFMSAGIFSFLLQSFNAVIYFCYIFYKKSDFLMWIFIAGNFVYLGLNGGFMVSLYNTIKSEILPYQFRGIGNGLCTSIQALSTVGFYQIFNVTNNFFGLYVNYIIFSVNSLILVWVVYVFLPETEGKTLAEIQKGFCENEQRKEKINKPNIVFSNE